MATLHGIRKRSDQSGQGKSSSDVKTEHEIAIIPKKIDEYFCRLVYLGQLYTEEQTLISKPNEGHQSKP